MPTAHPPVSQSEWDAALAAMTERERMVAAEMHELAAAPKRMPMERGGWARGVFDDGTMRLIDETYQRADAFLFGSQGTRVFPTGQSDATRGARRARRRSESGRWRARLRRHRRHELSSLGPCFEGGHAETRRRPLELS